MPAFDRHHVFLLPHVDEYRRFYDISVEEVVAALNDPDLHEGLADERYTAEKQNGNKRVYVYYYRTLPLHGESNEYFAIVDFVGLTTAADQPVTQKHQGKSAVGWRLI